MSLLANSSWKVQAQGFSREDAVSLCKNKLIVFVGDSVIRGMYKDLVRFLRDGKLLSEGQLRKKGEYTFEDDTLIEGGILDGLFNGKEYIEVREFRTKSLCVRFYFVTRCYYDYVETILQDFMEQPVPDVVYMASCLWDVTRWSDEVKSGENALCMYKANLEILFTRLEEVLPEHSILIWGCSLPLGQHVRGGFMDAAFKVQEKTLRLDILEANYFASSLAASHHLDVIDYHFFFRNFQHARSGDGIHWNSSAHRNMSFLLLYHLAEAWGRDDVKPKNEYAISMISSDSGLGRINWPSYDGRHVWHRDAEQHERFKYKDKLKNRERHRQDRRDAPYSRDRATYDMPNHPGDTQRWYADQMIETNVRTTPFQLDNAQMLHEHGRHSRHSNSFQGHPHVWKNLFHLATPEVAPPLSLPAYQPPYSF